MFLRKLLDPEEARRRRHLRARILRRNRIKKEIAQDLEPRLHRVPYDPTKRQDGYNWHNPSGADAAFLPTFGGNSDACDHRQDRYVAGTLRIGGASYRPVPAVSTPTTMKRKKKNEANVETNGGSGSIGEALNAATPSEPPTKVPPLPPQPLLPVPQPLAPPAAKLILSKARLRWHDVYERVIFRRHAEILAKDPKRRWRQE
ncbi:hypothetical protein FI667_g13332, partial [Globisporangium splendens]